MTLYEVLIDLSKKYCRFNMKSGKGYCNLLRFDLKKKKISNGNVVIMNNGIVLIDELVLNDGTIYTGLKDMPLIEDTTKDFYTKVEELYLLYNKSIPNGKECFSKGNFRAKTSDELTTDELLCGIPRVEAQYLLEGYILLNSIINKDLWEDKDKFFWKSENIPELVLFRDWFM